MPSKNVQGKFFNKTTATRGRKLNVRTLPATWLAARRRTALIACELARYNIDIAALSETKLPDEGCLVEMGTDYSFFWSGLPNDAHRIHGVGFAARTALLQSTEESPITIDERLMTLRFRLVKKSFATFVGVSSDDVKDRFYDTFYSTIRRISRKDEIIMLGDFNAKTESNHDLWQGVIGHHGDGNMNSSVLRMLSLCSVLSHAITNTFFQLRDAHKTSWMHPRSKHWHLIDYVIVRWRDLNEV